MTNRVFERRRWRQLPVALALLAPSAIILGAFIVYPLVKAVFLGTERCNSTGTRCIEGGWDQYADTFRSTEFQHALWVTTQFALVTVPLGLAFGIGLAVLAHKHLSGVGVFRAIFSSTVATSVAVASLMWLFLLQPSVGVLSNIGWIADAFPVIKQPGLLNDPGTALWSVALSSVWANLGFTFIIITAGLQGIPDDLYEAAALDGAGGTRRFWKITLPLLGPSLLFVLIVLTTRAFQAYGEIDLLTEGGPRPDDSTTTITYLTYGRNSIMATDQGLQATTAVLLFVVLLGLSFLQLWSLGRRVHYGD
ncbi:sn-glycerol 3-phosphate transport system permease protein [Ilumatobacter fluminis]|uniref:sn-glycerol 3-phosphate transport system permease protein n=1 Tax=Ilumatobacter fluminis TaxID=467091 RepID=A0A4R7I363_9ACTN|nr:sugar ABC transporter permease [Ilumatobacter fluminis]TDT17895.1 sn-glycerol 3-phosphate transport system permease protein [Ilumatobacter fluminis]